MGLFVQCILIFTTFMVVYLFRRRVLVRLVMSCFWLLLGIINGVILANRVTPLPDRTCGI